VGGVNSVRGFETSAIGERERDSITGKSYAVGGTKRIVGNAEIYFPVPGMKDSKQLRLSTFFDVGSVYGEDQTIELGDLRYSTGIGVSWYSPFGPLKVVLAKALNAEDTDKTEVLQFQFGSQF